MAELDLLDKKILNKLNQNVRAPYTEIAKAVRASKEVVNYRVNRLIENGIISSFVTVFGFGYWPYKVLIQFDKVSPSIETEIINTLKQQDYTTWITSCSGTWDLIFVLMAKDPAHFDNCLRSILKDIGKYVKDYKVSVSTGAQTFGHTYILKDIKDEKRIQKNVHGTLDFDEKDKLIAQLLRNNARIKLTEIYKKTKIPIDTVRYRIKKMETSGIIKRYRLILDPTKLGMNRYEIFLRSINLEDKNIAKFWEYSRTNPNIEYISKTIGSWDLELTVHSKNSCEFRKFVLEIKEQFGELLTSFESVTLFDTYTYSYLPEELK